MNLKKAKEKNTPLTVKKVYNSLSLQIIMIVCLIANDILLTLAVVPGTFQSTLHVNLLNSCNVLFLLPFTEGERCTEIQCYLNGQCVCGDVVQEALDCSVLVAALASSTAQVAEKFPAL